MSISKINHLGFKFHRFFLLMFLGLVSCEHLVVPLPGEPMVPMPGEDIVYIPVVVHVIHEGEYVGQGSNLSDERVIRQIEIVNEDFRKKEGTRGYNNHPDGGDAKIEFVLAKQTPGGEPSDGINRINSMEVDVPQLGYNQNHYAQYAYWPPEEYINIWTTPLDESLSCIILGSATGPLTDLPGTEYLLIPQSGDAEGILINWSHFGESDIGCLARYGRTLTHEIGHYFGLLHPWGVKDCELNDYCRDTPAVATEVYGQTPFYGCRDEPVMIANFMNWSDDEVMNIFTHEQIDRMHYVLKNHRGRHALMTSKSLLLPECKFR